MFIVSLLGYVCKVDGYKRLGEKQPASWDYSVDYEKAFKEFLKTSKTRIYMRAEKHKKEDFRLMVIPKELVEEDLTMCMPLLDKDKDVARANVNKYLHRKLGINCHSLRCAFITYMLHKGVNPSIVAAITGHKNMNIILKYTEGKEGETH